MVIDAWVGSVIQFMSAHITGLQLRSEQTRCDRIPSRLKQVYRRLHILNTLRAFQLLEQSVVLFLNGVHIRSIEGGPS